jgi:hypothetical protein
VEWINNFPDPCKQNTLSYCDDTSVGFLNGMVSRGHTATFKRILRGPECKLHLELRQSQIRQ